MFAHYGTGSADSAGQLLALIPLLWLSKLRQLRLLCKILLYLALPVIHRMDILLPLLPAPLQVIAQESVKMSQKQEQQQEEEVEDAEHEEAEDELLDPAEEDNDQYA